MRWLLVLLALTTANLTWAQNPQREALARAEQAEQDLDFARAETLYRDALLLDEGSRLSRRIRARLAWLEQHDEGGYAPLAALEAIRRVPRNELSLSQARDFEERLEGFVDGRVRREGLALVAELYLHRFDDPQAALEQYERWAESPGIDEAERQRARSGAALARAQLGGAGRGLAALEEAGLGHRAEAIWLRAQRIGWIGTLVAGALLLLFVALGLGLGGWRGFDPRALRQTLAWPRVGLAAWVLLVPAILSWLYDPLMAYQLAAVCASCAVIVAAAAIVGAGLRRSEASPTRLRLIAGLAGLATLGAAFIALDRSRLLFDILWSMEQLP